MAGVDFSLSIRCQLHCQCYFSTTFKHSVTLNNGALNWKRMLTSERTMLRKNFHVRMEALLRQFCSEIMPKQVGNTIRTKLKLW